MTPLSGPRKISETPSRFQKIPEDDAKWASERDHLNNVRCFQDKPNQDNWIAHP